MAVRRRGGSWVADYRDAHNVRRWVTCETREEARDAEAKGRLEAAQQRPGPMAPGLPRKITMTDYGPHFLKAAKARGLADGTLRRYEEQLRLHILPRVGDLEVRRMNRAVVKEMLQQLLVEGVLSRSTVRHISLALSAIFSDAVDQGLLGANPCAGIGRRLGMKGRNGGQEVEAMDTATLRAFLDATRQHEPAYYPAFAVAAWAGLRVGELLAVEESWLDFKRFKIHVRGQIGKPTKGRKARMVDMAKALAVVLEDQLAAHRAEAFRRGSSPQRYILAPKLPDNPTAAEVWSAGNRLREAMARVLKAANLPRHHSPHSLRHTFASQLLAAGVSPAFVQRQLGHASIKLTVDTYGVWLPIECPGAVDRLAVGSSLVANPAVIGEK